MDIYLYVDGLDFEEFANELQATLAEWLPESAAKGAVVNQQYRPNENQDCAVEQWDLGLKLSVSKGKHLTEPLNFLYDQAKKYKCDFVVGIDIDGSREDVCYFGKEEGKPDIYEISNYIGIRFK